MKKSVISALLCMLCLSGMAQKKDPVVMRINGKDVTRSEFEYNYNKNNTEGVLDKKDLLEYVDLFINYKLKVQAAEDAKLDTLTSYQQEFRQYRDQQIRPLLVTPAAEEAEIRDYYDNMVKSLEGHDLYLPAHIFVHLPQDAPKETQTAAKVRIDSIYTALKSGASFEQLAQQCSDDKQTGARGGLIQWIGPHQLLPELEEAIFAMKDSGEVAGPVLSTVGYHIIQLKGRKPIESYKELHDQIQRYLEQRGMKEQLASKTIDALAAEKGKTVDQILDEETERLCALDDELKYLVKEYHDGLLLFEICTREVWDPASKDTMGLQQYFKEHKKDYNWDQPHFMGMVYHCRQKSDVNAVKKLLKGVDESLWTKTVREHFNKDSVTVRMEQKLFAQGDNALADSLALKVKPVKKASIRKDFPYIGTVGTVLKKGPKKWTDVSAQVVADYQQERERLYVEELRKRYKVEVYDDVINTVNNH